MYRGSRPHQGSYPPTASRGFAPRGPPPASSFPSAPYRSEHARGSNGYPHGYRRNPEHPRRRYSSPGRGSADDFRGDGPPLRDYAHRFTPSPPHSGLPTDHSLVITVGNELTGSEVPYARDYSPHRSSFEGHDEHSSRRHSHSNRGWSRSPDRINSRSRPRSRSHSRAVSRSRALSRGRSRPRSRSRSRSRSRGRSRARSRARSKSRPHSRSRSRGRSKSRGQSRGRSRGRSRSCSGSSSSCSSSSRKSKRDKEDFRELERARRRKELEDMLTMPTKSILKKRVDSSETDSPMIGQSTDSPQGTSGSGLSKDAEQLLCAVTKNMDADLLASVLAQNSNTSALEELISKLQPTNDSGDGYALPHESSSQENSDLTQLLSVMAEAVAQPPDKKKSFVDIEDEEKFLYGDEEEVDKYPAKEMPKSGQCNLSDVYEKTGPDVLYHEPKTGVVHDLHRKEYGHSYSQGHPEEDEGQITKQGKYRDTNFSSSSTGQHFDEEPQSNPPVTGSHDAQVKAEVEEYEKIQDLLKTIGLDLGVAEISKMAARTQERLQGKNPVKSSVKRHQSERRRRSHSKSSSSNSRSRSTSRGSSRRSSRSSSYEHTSSRGRKKPPVTLERHSSRSDSQNQREVRSRIKAEENPWTNTGPPPPEVVNPGPNNFPALSAHQMPPYPQPHTRGVMPPNYPPPGYDPYGNYMPYMPQGWPMYPPPSMPMLPQTPIDDYSSPAVERPFLKVINTGANEAQGIDKKGSKVEPLQSIKIACSGNERRVIEEKNNAKQKQKVTEELEKLKKDRESRMKKKESLIKELETLRKQQGELLRKKRREKDGHKDPILIELGRLQEDVMAQISSLRTEHEAAEKKYEELVKVATILGLDHKNLRSSREHEHTPAHSKSKEPRSPEKSKSASITSNPQGTKSPAPGSSSRSDSLTDIFEYYDAGNHWCKNCNITSGSMFDFFTHLHSKMHRKTLDPYIRPWASNSEREKTRPTGELISKPAKGSEFVLPVRGFFCQLCKEFFGDPICAEAHVICHAHNEKYKKQMYENPLYEQRRNLDRQAGMESEKKQPEHKRKHEDEDSQDEQKNSKSSKDQVKKPKCKNEDEDRSKYIKEDERKGKYIKEEENKPKCKKEDIERTKCRKEEEERTRYAKEEVERNKFRKEEEERYRPKKGEDERYKSEEDKYRYRVENRYKYREDDKYRYRKEDEKSRYRKEDDKKYKYVHDTEEDRRPKYREDEGLKLLKPKWEEEDEEDERPKYGKKEDKKQHQKGGRKDEKEKPSLKDVKIDPEKLGDLPKVLCGPSPAMLAKLRKKSEEATSRPAFGKFTWKRPEKSALEKEAEKIAEQFIKEDEESVVASKDTEDQDAFAKSVAAAKSIAIKLSGKTSIAPSQEWVAYNQIKIRPNLPTPSNILRKSNVGPQNKPGSDDTASLAVPAIDASNKSSETVIKKQAENEDVLPADLISKAFDGEEVQLEIRGDNSASLASNSVSVPTTSAVTVPSSTVQEVEAVEVKAPTECMITLESDVAAPGVPKEEHKLTVMVRPPPKLQSLSSYSSSKTNKPRTSLAAAKAKDLFDIFYGSSTMASCSGSSAGKKVDRKQDSKADSGSLLTTVDKESTEVQDPNIKHVAEVSSLKCEELSEDRAAQSEPPTFDLEVEPLVESKTEEHCGSMEMATDGCKNEADSLDCLANSEIMENIELIGSNDDPEEAITLSFSPPPGSFTEQLNLDTFEFSFDSL